MGSQPWKARLEWRLLSRSAQGYDTITVGRGRKTTTGRWVGNGSKSHTVYLIISTAPDGCSVGESIDSEVWIILDRKTTIDGVPAPDWGRT